MRAVNRSSSIGLFILMTNTEILCDSKCPLLLLRYQLNILHNKNKAIKPDKKDIKGFWGIKAVTINATIAIAHHGKYKHAARLNNAISNIEIINFILKFKN